MAGKGGGSWKVAYADFVTAMMAFFLVMCISAQKKPLKKAIAEYFNDPWKTSAQPQGRLPRRERPGCRERTPAIRRPRMTPSVAGHASRRRPHAAQSPFARLRHLQYRRPRAKRTRRPTRRRPPQPVFRSHRR